MLSSDLKESCYFILADASRKRFTRLADAYNAKFADCRNGGESLKFMHSLVFECLLYQAIQQNDPKIERPQMLVRTIATDRRQIRRLLLQNRSNVKLPKAVSAETVYRYLERLIEAGIIEEKYNHAHLSFELKLNRDVIALWDIKAGKAENLAEKEELSKSDLYALQSTTCKEDIDSYRTIKKIKSGLPEQSDNKDVSASGHHKIDLPENEEQGKPKNPESNSAAPAADLLKKNEKTLAERAKERAEISLNAARRGAAERVLLFLLGYFFAVKPKIFSTLHSAELHREWNWTNFKLHNNAIEFQNALSILEKDYFGHIREISQIEAEEMMLKQSVRLAKRRVNASPTETRKSLDISYLIPTTYLMPGRFSLRKVRSEWLPQYIANNQQRKARRDAQKAETEEDKLHLLQTLRVKQIANAVLASKDEKAAHNAMFFIENAFPKQFMIDYATLIAEGKPIRVKPDRTFTSIVLAPDSYLEEQGERYLVKFRSDFKKGKFSIPNRQMWKWDTNGQIIGWSDWTYFKKTVFKRYHNITIN